MCDKHNINFVISKPIQNRSAMNCIRRVVFHCQQRALVYEKSRRHLFTSSVLNSDGINKYIKCLVSHDKSSDVFSGSTSTLNALVSKYIKCLVSPDKSSALVHLPGLGLGDMDRSRKVAPWSLVKQGESARLQAFGYFDGGQTNDLFQWQSTLSDNLMFLVSNSVYLQPRLSRPCVPYQEPIEYSIQLLQVGKTSFTHLEEMRLAETKEVLTNSVVKLVAVNRKTRKPNTLPDSFLEAFKDITHQAPAHIDPNKRISPVLPPVTSFTYSSKVEYSDLDYYFHTNHSNYIKFALNGINAASKGNHLLSLTGDISFKNLKEMHLLYQGETNAGDDITTCVWQEPDDPYKVNAVVQKQGIPVFTSLMVFES